MYVPGFPQSPLLPFKAVFLLRQSLCLFPSFLHFSFGFLLDLTWKFALKVELAIPWPYFSETIYGLFIFAIYQHHREWKLNAGKLQVLCGALHHSFSQCLVKKPSKQNGNYIFSLFPWASENSR